MEVCKKIFSFYIPDTFSPTYETIPQNYEAFQYINLRQTKSDAAAAGKVKIDLPTVVTLFKTKLLGLRWGTIWKLCSQLIKGKLNPLHKSRRPQLQEPVSFDIFIRLLRKNKPQLSTYFSNHVASTIHRYWKYTFPQDSGYTITDKSDRSFRNSPVKAIDITESQLKAFKDYADANNTEVMIASSLGQEEKDWGEYVGELRIMHSSNFAKTISFDKLFVNHMAMQPDFNFKFQSIKDRDDFLDKALQLVGTNGTVL